MGLFKRSKVGLALTKDSLLLVAHNPRLLLFPIISGTAGLAFLGLVLGQTNGVIVADGSGLDYYVKLFPIYFVLTLVSSFFTAGLVHQTGAILVGKEPSFTAGLRGAWNRKLPILVWSVIAATVGAILAAVEDSNSNGGKILNFIFSVAWTVMTFFIIPTIVFERPSITGMFKESARKFKQTFGETPISMITVRLVSVAIFVPFFVGGLLVVLNRGPVPVAVGVVMAGVLSAIIIGQTLQGVVKTSLYFYAEKGRKPSEFDDVDFTRLGDGARSSPQNEIRRDRHRP